MSRPRSIRANPSASTPQTIAPPIAVAPKTEAAALMRVRQPSDDAWSRSHAAASLQSFSDTYLGVTQASRARAARRRAIRFESRFDSILESSSRSLP